MPGLRPGPRDLGLRVMPFTLDPGEAEQTCPSPSRSFSRGVLHRDGLGQIRSRGRWVDGRRDAGTHVEMRRGRRRRSALLKHSATNPHPGPASHSIRVLMCC